MPSTRQACVRAGAPSSAPLRYVSAYSAGERDRSMHVCGMYTHRVKIRTRLCVCHVACMYDRSRIKNALVALVPLPLPGAVPLLPAPVAIVPPVIAPPATTTTIVVVAPPVVAAAPPAAAAAATAGCAARRPAALGPKRVLPAALRTLLSTAARLEARAPYALRLAGARRAGRHAKVPDAVRRREQCGRAAILGRKRRR